MSRYDLTDFEWRVIEPHVAAKTLPERGQPEPRAGRATAATGGCIGWEMTVDVLETLTCAVTSRRRTVWAAERVVQQAGSGE